MANEEYALIERRVIEILEEYLTEYRPMYNFVNHVTAKMIFKKPEETLRAKDWDERLTSEDTKELDEFLNSLARKGTLESAT